MKLLTDGRQITVNAADTLPLVEVDAALVQMVITHLIANALKYSPPGSPIAVGARIGTNSSGTNGAADDKVIIYVADRGPGIAEDEQPRIFEKFYRWQRGEYATSLAPEWGFGDCASHPPRAWRGDMGGQ